MVAQGSRCNWTKDSSCTLNHVLNSECLNSLRFNSFHLQQSFYCGFQWTMTTGHLVMSYHPLGSRLQCDWCWDKWMYRSILASWGAFLEFDRRLVWSVMDLMVLLFFCGCFWGHFSEKRQRWMVLFDLLQYQHHAAYFSFRVLKIQIRRISVHYLQRSFDWGFQWTMRYSFVLSFFGFTVGPGVEVGESAARVWPFGTRC